MNITLILQRSISAAYREICHGISTRSQRHAHSGRTDSHGWNETVKPPSHVPCAVEIKQPRPQKPKPLRVLRFVEGGMPHASVGRMVMSGSMADVCAELDRMVAQEMTMH